MRKPQPKQTVEPPPLALTAEELAEVERLGALQFAPREVAVVLGLPTHEWDEGTPVWTAYQRGRLRAAAEVREAIRRQALQGSAPAQKQFAELADRAQRLPPVKCG